MSRNQRLVESNIKELYFYEYTSLAEIFKELEQQKIVLSKTTIEFDHEWNSFGEIESTRLVVKCEM